MVKIEPHIIEITTYLKYFLQLFHILHNKNQKHEQKSNWTSERKRQLNESIEPYNNEPQIEQFGLNLQRLVKLNSIL